MQNARVMGSWRLPLRFQRKAWEVRQYFAQSESLQEAPERVIHDAIKVKPKLQWKPQDISVARNVESLLKKAAGNEWSHPKREAMKAANSRAMWVSWLIPLELTS
jgi:hypothetical protein